MGCSFCLVSLVRLERNIGQQAHLVGERRQVRGVFQALLDHVERHVASLLEVQNDLQAVNVLLGVLTIALRRAMRGDEPSSSRNLILSSKDRGMRLEVD